MDLPSVTAPKLMRSARRAPQSPVAHFLARAGLTARGIRFAACALWRLSEAAFGVTGERAGVRQLGMIGTIARGGRICLAGVLVIDAAVSHNAAESGGIDKALLTLRDQPFGEFLMLLAALGLLVFGVYRLCEARWRKV